MKTLSYKKIDTYMRMAHEIKELSPDLETKVGAVMLSEEGRIIASSFNGFLRGALDGSLPQTRPDKYEFIQHAERNMIYNCAYEGIKTKNTTMICTLSPCLECLRASFQSGIKTIIFEELYHKFPNASVYQSLFDLNVDVDYIGSYTILNMKGIKE